MEQQIEESFDDSVPDEPSPAAPRRRPRPRLLDRLTWTPRQRRGMAVILATVIVILILRSAVNTAFVDDPQPTRPTRFDDLRDSLDPNTASWQELAAIPSLGEKRARAIVEHREDWLKRHPARLPYQEPLDLAAVTGIGATMIEQMTPYLTFPLKSAR